MTSVYVYASVVVCNLSKIVEAFRSRVWTWQGYAFSFDIFNQLVIFVYLEFDVFAFDHLPSVVVCNYETLSDDVFDSIFEDKRIPNIFCILIRSIDIEQIVK